MTIPTRKLNDGAIIPTLGFGTWQLPEERVPEVLNQAVKAGYRHFDTAHAYLNEEPIGNWLDASGVARSEIFLTSKLWNDRHGYDETIKAFNETLNRIGTDYLDLYLIHWPVPMVGLYAESWKAMVHLKGEGRIRSIGVSNFEQNHLERILDETGVAPSVNQIELHPRFQQLKARAFHEAHNIAIESWSPLGQGNMMQNSTLVRIANKHKKSSAQVMLRWHLDQNLIVIPRSKTAANIKANTEVFDFVLDADDMLEIAKLDEGARGRIGPKPNDLGPVALPKSATPS